MTTTAAALERRTAPGVGLVALLAGLAYLVLTGIQVTNPMLTLPKLRRYRDALKKDDRFIVVSDVYPTPTTDVADVVLPAAMWIEREGMWGNSERRTQHFERMLTPPGEAMSDAWQMIEVARRLGFEKLFPWSEATHI